MTVGTVALGALAIGAVAIGALAIGRLFVGRARIRRLEIGELVVRRLRVTEQLTTPSRMGAESESNDVLPGEAPAASRPTGALDPECTTKRSDGKSSAT